MSVDEMPAGRALDALVAEKVMGLEVIGYGTAIHVEGEWSVHLDSDPSGWACYAGKEPLYVAGCNCKFLDSADWAEHEASIENEVRDDMLARGEEWRHTEPEPKLGGHYSSCLTAVPRYSTSIAAAWEVVEKMREKGYDFDLGTFTEGDVQVHFLNGDGSYEGHEMTAPLAISRAALRVVGA